MFGIGDDRLIEIGERGSILLNLTIGERTIGIGAGEIRVDLDRFGEILDGVLIASYFRIGGAARVIGDRIVGIALDDVAQRGNVDRACAGCVDFDFGHIAGRRGAEAGRLTAGKRQRYSRNGENPHGGSAG
jgi:hypothetical protein